MDTDCGELFWDLFKRFGGIDAYICYSEYKKANQKPYQIRKGDKADRHEYV